MVQSFYFFFFSISLAASSTCPLSPFLFFFLTVLCSLAIPFVPLSIAWSWSSISWSNFLSFFYFFSVLWSSIASPSVTIGLSTAISSPSSAVAAADFCFLDFLLQISRGTASVSISVCATIVEFTIPPRQVSALGATTYVYMLLKLKNPLIKDTSREQYHQRGATPLS